MQLPTSANASLRLTSTSCISKSFAILSTRPISKTSTISAKTWVDRRLISWPNILSFEADRRTINITVNSLGTGLTKDQRAKLFPTIGRLYPEGNNILARADEIDQVRSAVEAIPEYRDFFTPTSHSVGDLDDDAPHQAAESLEDHFFRVSRDGRGTFVVSYIMVRLRST